MECECITAERLRNFHSGNEFKAYEIFGCHKCKGGFVFRVWAPHAKGVTLTFIDGRHEEMRVLSDGETYECVTKAATGDKYAFVIHTRDNRYLFKSDPYAFASDLPNSRYSVISQNVIPSEYPQLHALHDYNLPVNIYEVNLLSWKRHADNSYYTYSQLRRELVPYVKKMGYTHVELMPVTEYPFDGSWGYQVTGYFSVAARLGSAEDFKALVDAFHAEGIKVILDWVPAHFPKDDWGLYEFDGQPTYECPLWDRMEHAGWGTRRFDYGRGEVDSFLISSALYFFDKFRIDGIRVDAVASMLYLNYDRNEGDFTPNKFGDSLNLEGAAFIRKLNAAVKDAYSGAITVAEESTAFPKVTAPVKDGGLGFDYKWNMGWMNDVLFYCRQDPYYRNYHHNKMTFSLVYAFSERFILPVSHDEVVHVKGSVVNKMSGEYVDKFSGERLFLAFMYAHPGKKLNFMGYEVAQFKEWDYNAGLDLFLADEFELHGKMRAFVKELNGLYSRLKPLYNIDNGWDGFEWLVVDDSYHNVFAFNRYSADGQSLTAVFNFSGIDQKNYRIKLKSGKYGVILNTDDKKFGGEGKLRKRIFNTVKQSGSSEEYCITIDIPRLSCLYLLKDKT